MCFIRNAEENSLSGSKRMTINIIKNLKGSINLTGNGKYVSIVSF